MRVVQFDDLPPLLELAVIINVGTKNVATLSLLSSLRYAAAPVLLIDCESRDGSFDWFGSLLRSFDFYLMSMSRRPHGATLDSVFRQVRCERLLLIDSDVELLNGEMLQLMRTLIHQDPSAYGSGYFQRAESLKEHYGTGLQIAPGIGLYKARPWIPFTLFRVAPVCEALKAGRSFMHKLALNEFHKIPPLSRILWRRFQLDVFRRKRLSILDPFRTQHDGMRPAYVFYDTGADIHEYLTGQDFSFCDVGADLPPWSVVHLQGVTRDALQGPSHDAHNVHEANARVKERLASLYNITVDNP